MAITCDLVPLPSASASQLTTLGNLLVQWLRETKANDIDDQLPVLRAGAMPDSPLCFYCPDAHSRTALILSMKPALRTLLDDVRVRPSTPARLPGPAKFGEPGTSILIGDEREV